jgi:hypothetical protein
LATSELAVELLEEYDKHDIQLQETKAYSPASIGKAYLRRMGIEPILQRQPDFPKSYLGYAQSAFFGGRTSAHIRNVPVPVVYTDSAMDITAALLEGREPIYLHHPWDTFTGDKQAAPFSLLRAWVLPILVCFYS